MTQASDLMSLLTCIAKNFAQNFFLYIHRIVTCKLTNIAHIS